MQLTSLAVEATGSVVCAGAMDPFDIYVWSLQTGALLDVLSGHEGFSPFFFYFVLFFFTSLTVFFISKYTWSPLRYHVLFLLRLINLSFMFPFVRSHFLSGFLKLRLDVSVRILGWDAQNLGCLQEHMPRNL